MVTDFNGCSVNAQEADTNVIGLRLADLERKRFWDPQVSRAHSVDNLLVDIAEDVEFVNSSLVIGDLGLFLLNCVCNVCSDFDGAQEVIGFRPNQWIFRSHLTT